MIQNDEPEELDPVTYAHINSLMDSGDEYVENGEYERAIALFERALALVPEPITDWEISTNLLVAIGETYFFAGEFEKAHANLVDAMYCPKALGNPFIHLRLGQAQFEVGNMRRATDELVRAYMGGGEERFEGEDPKYFALIKASIRL